ncbi:hypothetical protein GGR51DRAFT_467970 [Nemania sp. FL0031]|nr:hypothetical protein GGR51DRAFT_467970 [Nemania sp. FL0031]
MVFPFYRPMTPHSTCYMTPKVGFLPCSTKTRLISKIQSLLKTSQPSTHTKSQTRLSYSVYLVGLKGVLPPTLLRKMLFSICRILFPVDDKSAQFIRRFVTKQERERGTTIS